MRARKQHGMTLIELLVTVSIAAILLTIAVPSFRDFFARTRLDSAASDFMVNLNYARSEAIRRGVPVSLCKSNNGTSCNNGLNWEDGWILFANTDNDSPAVVDVGEDVLRFHQALPQNVTLRPNNNYANFLTYRPDGRVNNIGTFAICHDGALVGARSITIVGTGRPRYGADTTNDNIPEKDVGGVSTNINSCTNP